MNKEEDYKIKKLEIETIKQDNKENL